MQNPVVSVIISNYNYGSYLRAAIESALNQTYKNVEIIVVDDGSTDHSRDILASYKNYIIPILKENGGQASAWNAGFSIARGEIICFLDSDDLWLPTKVKRIVDILSAVNGIGMIRHKLRLIPEQYNYPPQEIPSFRTSSIEAVPPSQILEIRFHAPSSALSFLKNVLAQLMPIPEEDFRISADSYLYTFAPLLGKVVSLDEVLGYYRVHDRNRYYSHSMGLEVVRKQLQTEQAIYKWSGRFLKIGTPLKPYRLVRLAVLEGRLSKKPRNVLIREVLCYVKQLFMPRTTNSLIKRIRQYLALGALLFAPTPILHYYWRIKALWKK